jgi:hypothetical protein
MDTDAGHSGEERMYEPAATLAAIDANPVPVLLLCAVALAGNALYYFECMRLGFSQQTYGMPIAGLFFFIPHDMTYVLLWQKWFVEYDHWFLKLFWVGLVVTSLAAWVFLWQAVRYGHRELMPQWSRAAFTLLVLAGLLACSAAWWAVKNVLDDELFLFAFGFTAFWCAPFGTALMLRRRSRLGNSQRMWAGYTAIPLYYWPATMLYLPDGFRSPAWVALGAVAVLWGLANVVLARSLPAPLRA